MGDAAGCRVDAARPYMDGMPRRMDGALRHVDAGVRRMAAARRYMDGAARRMDAARRRVDGAARRMDEKARRMDEKVRRGDRDSRKFDAVRAGLVVTSALPRNRLAGSVFARQGARALPEAPASGERGRSSSLSFFRPEGGRSSFIQPRPPSGRK